MEVHDTVTISPFFLLIKEKYEHKLDCINLIFFQLEIYLVILLCRGSTLVIHCIVGTVMTQYHGI
jgi:hypothetical protein